MRILLINPPYQTITSNLGVGHQVPLGLLLVGGSLIDAGFDVQLLDAEARRLTDQQIADHVAHRKPDVIMTGHAGSTPAHPACVRMLRAIRARHRALHVYGGVFPTYHARAILCDEPAVDVIVRGEGECIVRDLAQACDHATDLRRVAGISFRDAEGHIVRNDDPPPIRDLNAHRAAWELIDDWNRYQCFGLGRAAIVQFSRGCPHRCTYCGQHGFWRSWRHRDPQAVAREMTMLHDRHGVRFITLADENPTTDPRAWRELLEALAAVRQSAGGRDLELFATIRAADIVRDAGLLELYRRAGILYVLLGIDATDPALIESIRKRSSASVDQRACAVLRAHGIRSIVAHIVGLGEDSLHSFWRAFRILCRYDGDLLNVMYATPHSWTAFARETAARPLVDADQAKWDYRHQVLGERRLSRWQLFALVKALELAFHLRPRALGRLLLEGRGRRLRRQRWWTLLHIAAVWLGEVAEFITRRRAVATAQAENVLRHGHDAQGAERRPRVTLTWSSRPRPASRAQPAQRAGSELSV